MPFILFILALLRPSKREATAQMAAGSHPIKVICKIKQIIPCIIFPLKMKDNQGKRTANMIIVFYLVNFLFHYNVRLLLDRNYFVRHFQS